MHVFRPFVPDKLLPQIEFMLEQLAGKTIRNQLKQQRISQIKIFDEETGTKARLIPTRENSLCILLRAERCVHWPIDIGHELGHTFFYEEDETGVLSRINRRSSKEYDEEEALCEWFGFIWANRYYEEAMLLIASFAGDKNQRGIQLMLWPRQLELEGMR